MAPAELELCQAEALKAASGWALTYKEAYEKFCERFPEFVPDNGCGQTQYVSVRLEGIAVAGATPNGRAPHHLVNHGFHEREFAILLPKLQERIP